MLLLDSKTIEIDGISVFPDHADPLQFYYMPLAPHLTIRQEGTGPAMPAFSLIRFKGEAGTGGFVNFDVNLGLPADKLQSVKSAVQRQITVNGDVRLAPVPVVDGSVHLLMLGTDSSAAPADDSDSDSDTPAEAGPTFVLTINHAAKPSLYGDNQAAFSVQLSQEGVSVVTAAMDGEIMPIAVVYSLQYLGLRPAYSVTLTIDWDRVQKHMDETFGTNMLFVSTEIGKAVDDLVDSRAIQFEADSFVTDDTEAEGNVVGRRDAAIAQVRAMITDAFFTPSLPPWTPGNGSTWSQDLQKAADVMSLIAAGPAAGATSKSLFSYKKMDYKRTDKKSLNVNFSERSTVKRSIFPQGHLAGMFDVLRAPGIDRARFVTDVDLDDPWFKRRSLTVTALTDFTSDSISAINVRANYNDQPKNALLRKGSESASFQWASKLDGTTMHMPLDLQYDVMFGGVDTTERPNKVASPVAPEDGEQVGLDPRALYAMSPVPIVAVNFPWETYSQVEVHTRYTDAANQLAQGDVFRLTKEAAEALWTIFILDTSLRSFDYKCIFRAVDHKDHETDWTTTDEESITVVDPLPRKREVQVVAAMDWDKVDRCFVDLAYRDPANHIDKQQSLDFIKGDGSKSAVFEMEDPTQRQLAYSALIMMADGSTIEIPESTTTEARILIRADMKGKKVVEIRPPADFAAQRLTKVTAELRFEDFAAGLSFANSFDFQPGSAAKTFEYDFVDPTRSKYEDRVTYLYDNGMQRVVEWQPGDDSVLQLAAP